MTTDGDRARLVLDTLEIPAPGPSPALLLVLSGLPASGKSMLAARLAARHPFCVVATDLIRKTLFPDRIYTGEESATTHRAAHEAPRRLLGEAAGARAVGLQLAVSAELVRERLRGLTAERAGSEAGMEVYELLLAEFEPEPKGAAGVIPPCTDLEVAICLSEKVAGLGEAV